MAGLCAVSADHVHFLLLLADSYHQSSGHQCHGQKRYLPEAGAGEKGAEPGGAGFGHVLFRVRDGDAEGHAGFSLYFCQCGAEPKAFGIQHLSSVDGRDAVGSSLRSDVCRGDGRRTAAGRADSLAPSSGADRMRDDPVCFAGMGAADGELLLSGRSSERKAAPGER